MTVIREIVEELIYTDVCEEYHKKRIGFSEDRTGDFTKIRPMPYHYANGSCWRKIPAKTY